MLRKATEMGSILLLNIAKFFTFSLPGKACCWGSAGWHGYPCGPGTDSCSGSSDLRGGSDSPGIDSIS